MHQKTKGRLVWAGVLAVVASIPAVLTGYVLGYHSAFPIYGGGPMAAIVTGGVVSSGVFGVLAARAWFLSKFEGAKE